MCKKQHYNVMLMQILASEIDFWRLVKEGKDLHSLDELKMYPPRVTFHVDCTAADVFTLKFTFTGFPESYRLNRDIMFPLKPAPLSPLQVAPLQAAGNQPYYNISSWLIN